MGFIEGEGEGGVIAREGIEHSQNRQPQRCVPCHADVVGGPVRRAAVPAAEAELSNTLPSLPARPKSGIIPGFRVRFYKKCNH